MLVFTRRRDQSVIIGDGIEVRILRVGRDGVRVGVVAPPSVPVHRGEVYDQIRAANAGAVTTATDLSELLRRLRPPRAPDPVGQLS
jgi:carbon storage regulator